MTRAAVADRRLVPAGVDIAPPLSMWTLTGGATYDPATKEVTMPAVGATATSPLLRVDAATGAVYAGPVYVPSGGDDRTQATMAYYGPDGVTPVLNTGGHPSNGAAVVGDSATWRTWTRSAVLGPGITYLQWAVSISSSYGVPGTKYRQPAITLSR